MLPKGDLRFRVAASSYGTALLWGLAGPNEPNEILHEEHGKIVETMALAEVMRGLNERLDLVLLKRSEGGPAVRRLLCHERGVWSNATSASAMLIRPGERIFMDFYRWLPADRFAVLGEAAAKAAELADMGKWAHAKVDGVLGNPIVRETVRAKPHHKLKPSLGFGGGVQ